MEKKKWPCPGKFRISLKDLPPIDPSAITNSTSQCKYEKPNTRNWPKEGIKLAEFDQQPVREDFAHGRNLTHRFQVEERDVSFCSTKHIDPNSTKNFSSNEKYDTNTDAIYKVQSCNKDTLVGISPKSQLHEVCAAKNWKYPVFTCCKEEGPCHMRLFTYKVVIEIVGAELTTVECFGGPKSTKKKAAEHAAEGALWYLKNLGHFPINK